MAVSAESASSSLAANKDAVYGDPLKVSYSATLTWGAPVEVSIGVTGVPTSQMTDEQIDLAYKTGTNTGLRYDAITVKPIEGMTEDMIRGVDIGTASLFAAKNASCLPTF